MEDLRKLLAPPGKNSPAILRRQNFESKHWAIKYIGRKLNAECLAKFPDANTTGLRIELPWEGQEKYVSHNCYDDSTFTHELVVLINSEGPAIGRISDINAHHWNHWHTSSNWQDHSESHTYEERLPNDDEVKSYEQMLDKWTEGGSSEQIDRLVQLSENIAVESDGKIIVWCSESKLTLRFMAEEPFDFVVSLDDLRAVLDISHVYPEILFSRYERNRRVKLRNDSWQFDYILTLFNCASTPELYQDLDGAIKAWLFGMFLSCEQHRIFMGTDSADWWRDAWWRIQELMSNEHRQQDHIGYFNEATRNKHYSTGAEIKSPYVSYVGKIGVIGRTNTCTYVADNGIELSGMVKGGGRKMPTFKLQIINGVEWSYCITGGGVTINLVDSKVVGDGLETVVVPARIDGHCVTELRSLGKVSVKDWRHVVIEEATAENEYELTTLDIGVGAFKDWECLESITIRPTVTLSRFAFENCTALKTVKFGKSVYNIGSCAFQGCSELNVINEIRMWGGGWNGIGDMAFHGCHKLEKVQIDCMAKINLGTAAFLACENIESIVVHEKKATKQQESRRYIRTDPARVGFRCFEGCAKLREVLLGCSCKIIETDAFKSCNSLEVIQHDGDNFWFHGRNCTGSANVIHWDAKIKYRDYDEMVLSDLLDKLGIEREKYIAISSEHSEHCIGTVIDILTGKATRHRRMDDFADDYDDYTPRTCEDAYEIYGSRLWDA